mmetsp:Transcript_81009/g.224083  ORF Transcript_81009/g.224083 Transcript_81009/m.224083 type:complete len:202 (-) Transcript_81009:127-732(-)
MQHLADGLALCHGVHLAPELVAHEAADGGPRERLYHGLPDVHLSLDPWPFLLKELLHLFLECTHVGAEAVVGQALADETELAHSGAVIRVIEHLGTEDGYGEGIHLGLVQVLVHRKEELMPLGAHQKDHILCQEVDFEALTVLLVTLFDELERVLQELDDRTKDGQTEACGELRGRLPRPPPPANNEASNHADRGASRHNG